MARYGLKICQNGDIPSAKLFQTSVFQFLINTYKKTRKIQQTTKTSNIYGKIWFLLFFENFWKSWQPANPRSHAIFRFWSIVSSKTNVFDRFQGLGVSESCLTWPAHSFRGLKVGKSWIFEKFWTFWQPANPRSHANSRKNVPEGFKSCFDTARL